MAQRLRGFTLIELLVVIGIIALLASMLLPMVVKAKRTANAADSLNNLRQIVAASMAFATDHEGHFPLGFGYEWRLKPYLQDPQSSRTIYVSRNADRKPTVTISDPITYSVHGFMMDQGHLPDLGRPVSLMRNPGRLILVADGIQAPNNNWQANWHFQNPAAYVYGDYDSFTEADLKTPLEPNEGGRGIGPDQASANAGWFRYCNNGSVAAGFGDGHAALIKKGEVIAGNLVP